MVFRQGTTVKRGRRKDNLFQFQISHEQLISLHVYIHMLFQYHEHLSELLKEISILAKSFEEYRLI